MADQLILDGIRPTELPSLPTSPSPFPSTSSSLSNPRDLKVTYISRHQYSTNPSPPKNSKPTPVSFPSPATHNLEQRPTRTLCIFCRWQRSQFPLEALKSNLLIQVVVSVMLPYAEIVFFFFTISVVVPPIKTLLTTGPTLIHGF